MEQQPRIDSIDRYNNSGTNTGPNGMGNISRIESNSIDDITGVPSGSNDDMGARREPAAAYEQPMRENHDNVVVEWHHHNDSIAVPDSMDWSERAGHSAFICTMDSSAPIFFRSVSAAVPAVADKIEKQAVSISIGISLQHNEERTYMTAPYSENLRMMPARMTEADHVAST